MKNWVRKYQSAWTPWGKERVLKSFSRAVEKSLWDGDVAGLVYVMGSNAPAPLTQTFDSVIQSNISDLLKEKPERVGIWLRTGWCFSFMFRHVAEADIAVATQILLDKKAWGDVRILADRGIYPFSFRLHPQTIYKTAMSHFLQADNRTQAEMGPLAAHLILEHGKTERLHESQIEAVRAEMPRRLTERREDDPFRFYSFRGALSQLMDSPHLKEIVSADLIEQYLLDLLDASVKMDFTVEKRIVENKLGEEDPAISVFKKGVLTGDVVKDLKRLYNLRHYIAPEIYSRDVMETAQHIIEKFAGEADAAKLTRFVYEVYGQAESHASLRAGIDIGDDFVSFVYSNMSWIPVRKMSHALIEEGDTRAYVYFLNVLSEFGPKHTNYVSPETVRQCADLLMQAEDRDGFIHLMRGADCNERLTSQISRNYIGETATRIAEAGDTRAQSRFIAVVMGNAGWESALPGSYRDLHWIMIPSAKETHEYDIVMRFSEASDVEFFAGCLHKKGMDSLREHWKAHANPQRRTKALPLVKHVLRSLALESRIDVPHLMMTSSPEKFADLAMREMG